MKLTSKGHYAVMAMADLALNRSGKPVSLAAIATRQGISLSYLEQLFVKLRCEKLVTSTRGPGGGYTLARPPEALHISDIIMAVDEPIKATRCQGKTSLSCSGLSGRCLTHDLWDELTRHIYLFLNTITLEDVIEKRIMGRSAPGNLFDPNLPYPPAATVDLPPEHV